MESEAATSSPEGPALDLLPPVLTSLPEILAALESCHLPTRTKGAYLLGRTVDLTEGEQGQILGEFIREVGAIELLTDLLASETSAELLRTLLTVVGNVSSNAFDANASKTRRLLHSNLIVARLIPLLHSPDVHVKLYATAALQNLCISFEIAVRALESEAHVQLEALCKEPPTPLHRHFAAGALINIDCVLRRQQASISRSPIAAWRHALSRRTEPAGFVVPLGEAAVAAIRTRKQSEQHSRTQAKIGVWRRQQTRNRHPRDETEVQKSSGALRPFCRPFMREAQRIEAMLPLSASAPAEADDGNRGEEVNTTAKELNTTRASKVRSLVTSHCSGDEADAVELVGIEDELAGALSSSLEIKVVQPTQELLQNRLPFVNHSSARSHAGGSSTASWATFFTAASTGCSPASGGCDSPKSMSSFSSLSSFKTAHSTQSASESERRLPDLESGGCVAD
mmetsp:Transcript_46119/g.76228  ORF Transcript_46119/g.76228 Transcript_46119/m.76228 type:complete len:455 (-) Transcript_46119:279-1643(-)